METYLFSTIRVLSVLMIVCISLDQVHSISHYRFRHAFDYLQTFGYLPANENSVITRKQFVKAVRQLQKYGHLQITGIVDESTVTLMNSPRCGVPDKPHIAQKRHKRYKLGPHKWHKNPVTWNYNHKYGRYYHEANKIRTIISAALAEWGKHTTLQFGEVASDDDGDINISFERQYHPDVDSYGFDDSYGLILAHAFSPGPNLGGDIHFREDIEWDFDVMYGQQPSESKLSFYAVALHELGHSLGLDHEDSNENAVMHQWYTSHTGTLSHDDIMGIQHIYGVPETDSNEFPFHVPDDSNFPTENKVPDKCNTSYDAIALLRGELFIFKDAHLWRADDGYTLAIEIRKMWLGLPDDLTNVDAVYENGDGKIMIFIGLDVFIFDATTYEYRIRLDDLGLHSSIRKIDAIFKWNYNDKTYIFSGNQYWEFNEENYRVNADIYPRRIDTVWRDVYDVDTAFTSNNRLYFFKGVNYYEFDDRLMRMKRMDPQLSSIFWMKCPNERAFLQPRFDDEKFSDFIKLDLDDEEVIDNFEKSASYEKHDTTTTQSGASSNQFATIFTIVVLCCFSIFSVVELK